jgi:hypothetical protein
MQKKFEVYENNSKKSTPPFPPPRTWKGCSVVRTRHSSALPVMLTLVWSGLPTICQTWQVVLARHWQWQVQRQHGHRDWVTQGDWVTQLRDWVTG